MVKVLVQKLRAVVRDGKVLDVIMSIKEQDIRKIIQVLMSNHLAET